MSLDLTTRKAPQAIARLTLGAADVATQVILPNWVQQVGFRFVKVAGKIATEGADAAAIDSHYIDLPAGEQRVYESLAKNRSADQFYLASATADTVVEIEMESVQ